MNHRTHRPERALPGHLLTALFLSSLPSVAQTIANPGFEANSFNAGTFPGYISGALNGPITGWTGAPTNHVGLNPAAGSPFANNGAIPGGANVAFLQAGTDGPATLKTTATGLTPGVKYNVSFRINARSGTTFNVAYLTFSTDGTGPTTTAEVTRVSTAVDATPYRYAAFEFTATAASHELTIGNVRTSGDHTLVIDDVVIAPSSNAWSFSEWTGDADSGIDPQYVYTHAYNVGANDGVTINGVRFLGRETITPGRFAIGGLPGTAAFGAGVLQVGGDSAKLATSFRHGGVPAITLQGLKPNTQYVFSVYGAGWDALTDADPHRAATFSSSLGGDKYTVNLNHFGKGHGIIVNYTYTTDAQGSDVVINYPSTAIAGNNTPVVFHTSGFSNREAVASTPQSAWTTAAWTDDESSGVDNTRLYTHAYSFGTTANLNINGVAFTGVGGVNPTTATYSSTLPEVYSNDTNNAITGISAALSRDFAFGAYPEVHTLTGLTPGKQYVFTMYSTGWDVAGTPRVGGFFGNAADAPAFLDQNEFGQNNGIRLEYRYTADASGTLKVRASSYDGAASIHCCGISNREADPMASVAPTITLQPVGATLGRGLSFQLRVGAIGSPNITYQWKRNNVPIASATGPVLDLPAVDFSDAGDYTVTVTNDVSSVTSNVAALVVLDNVPGAASTGVGFDGLPLAPGEIDPHYTLIANPDNPESSIAYVESSIAGSWVPSSETSRWIGPRVDTNAALGAPAADGEGPGTYVYRTQIDLTNYDLSSVTINGQWATDNSGLAIRVNGTVVTGLVNNVGNTFSVLQPFSITSTNATLINGVNTVDFVVQNETNGLTGLRVERFSALGTLPPNTAPHIAFPPLATVGRHNTTAVLGVAASGSPPLTYQWYYNDQEIPGETLSSLSIPVFDPSVAGNYKVKVTNSVSSVTTENVALTVPNASPVAEFDEVTAVRDTPLEIDSLELLINDTDLDGDVLNFTGVAAASTAGGTVVLNSGLITYTPPAGFTGSDDFTYTVSDGIWGGTATGHVLITVNGAGGAGAPGPVTLVVSGGTATGTFTGTPGASYTLQRSVDLTTWLEIQTVTAGENGNVQVSDPAPPALRAFYRISYTP